MKKQNRHIKDRRKHERFTANDGAFASLSPNSSKLGQIINISRGGLAFRYIYSQQDDEAVETHVFLSSRGYYVGKIPATTVEDCDIRNSISFSAMRLRKCRIKFGELTLNQMVNLDHYIWNNIC